jgi:hypothetical protein
MTESVTEHVVYVFMVQRQVDKEAFPIAYTDRNLAEFSPNRVSQVVEVKLTCQIALQSRFDPVSARPPLPSFPQAEPC